MWVEFHQWYYISEALCVAWQAKEREKDSKPSSAAVQDLMKLNGCSTPALGFWMKYWVTMSQTSFNCASRDSKKLHMLSSADQTSCCLPHNCGKSCTFRYYKPPLSILSNNRPTLIHCSFRPSPPSSAPITRQENGKLVQLFVKGGKRDPGFHFANWLPQQLGGITWSAGISAMKEAVFQFWNPISSLPQAALVKSNVWIKILRPLFNTN